MHSPILDDPPSKHIVPNERYELGPRAQSRTGDRLIEASPALRHQRSSEVIRVHQRPSEASRGHAITCVNEGGSSEPTTVNEGGNQHAIIMQSPA